MTMPCDHTATKASLQAFLAVTKFVGFQCFPDGEVQLLANCVACGSTLAVAIEMPRGPHGNEAAGEIGAVPQEPAPAAPLPVVQCSLNAWCCDPPGHAGNCVMPF